MTKEHALSAYKHFRKLETSYEPREGLNSGPTSMTRVRARAKQTADNILIRNPEFVESEKPKEEKKDDGRRKKPTTN